MAASTNPLVTSAKASDSQLAVKLHPLVLLTITDYISRHALTMKQDPIVGAVIGQQDGREVTMEHAFEVLTTTDLLHHDGKQRVLLDDKWFANRLDQYKTVHKDQALDLVALFTLGSVDGPHPEVVPMVQFLKANYNDDVKLILFHPDAILNESLSGGKLPITVWESLYEPGSEAADKGLQVDGWGIGTQLQLKFRQIPFDVETGEAEMIGVDHVAAGAANATMAAPRKQSASAKGKAVESQRQGSVHEATLSPEDEELIASLTSKSNAIKMLHTRLQLLISYLTALPASHLTDPSLPPAPGTDHILLRQISALLSRLPLLSPPSASAAADVDQVALLSTLTDSLSSARALTTKARIVTRARQDGRAARLAREAGPRDARRPMGYGDLSDTGFDSGADAGEY